MTIGIKYCGGCNPRYNRKQAVETLVEAFPHWTVSTAYPNVCYDVLVVVCGCSATCATISDLQATQTFILATQADVDACIQQLKKET
ncbi:hypothetical protein RFF05_02870 [Bengtsoniella intestinalis]|uniref:hypothetical protein n=1 Tax=Bengtsoniella intestinalis TaxID=3073143 RepID=UPI00391F5C3E